MCTSGSTTSAGVLTLGVNSERQKRRATSAVPARVALVATCNDRATCHGYRLGAVSHQSRLGAAVQLDAVATVPGGDEPPCVSQTPSDGRHMPNDAGSRVPHRHLQHLVVELTSRDDSTRIGKQVGQNAQLQWLKFHPRSVDEGTCLDQIDFERSELNAPRSSRGGSFLAAHSAPNSTRYLSMSSNLRIAALAIGSLALATGELSYAGTKQAVRRPRPARRFGKPNQATAGQTTSSSRLQP